MHRTVKSLYRKITLNKLTASFFLFGVVHCLAQGLIHSFLFSIDAEYSNLLNGIVRVARIPPKNHTFFDPDTGNGQLVMCNELPHNSTDCSVIYKVGDVLDATLDAGARGELVRSHLKTGFNMTGNPGGVTLVSSTGENVTLSTLCTSTLVYPTQLLQNYKREDLAWVFLQFYLLYMSVTAMIYDSVPHLITGLAARVIYTGWTIYAVYRTNQRAKTFEELIENPGTPCSVEIFTDYDATRLAYEIPDLVLSLSALAIGVGLTRQVYQVYKGQFFRCMGAPERIAKLYKWFMAVQATLQLESFVLVTAMGLWIDQLFNTYIHALSEHDTEYKAAFITTTILVLPWLVMGWYAIRNEHHIFLVAFLTITFGLIVGWGTMFYSQVYRWTFVAWPNLACYLVLSFVLLVTILILGIVSRLNFGKGLKQYLLAEAELAKQGFGESVFEHDVKAGISWDPPPLKKVLVNRPGSPPELHEISLDTTLSRDEKKESYWV